MKRAVEAPHDVVLCKPHSWKRLSLLITSSYTRRSSN